MPVVDSSGKQPAQRSFIMLPPEILDLVCRLLPKQSLKQLRQVSKTWERAAVPYLFDEIFISQNVADFRIAKLAMLQFKYYIRTLVFSSIHYIDMDRESFDEDYDEEFGIDIETNTETCDSSHAFKLYRITRKHQKEIFSNGSSSAYLSLALTSLPNIQKIVLTDTPSSRSMTRQSFQVHHLPELKAYPFSATDHLPHAVRQSGFSRKGSANPWRLVLFALSATNANVKELTMEPGDMESSTNTAAFSMPPGILGPLKLSFGTLAKIRLSLLPDTERFSTNVNKLHFHQNVGKLLRSAVNLKSLSLDMCEHSTEGHLSPTLQEILGRCKFPKLRSLNLAFLTSSELELLRLLKHSKNLEYITLECHALTEGFWVRVADWIRASLPLLRHAELNQLYGGFDEPWEEDTEYNDTYGQVGDFFFAQGENPFTKKALEKYHADKKAGRQIVNCDGGIGHIEAYLKYH